MVTNRRKAVTFLAISGLLVSLISAFAFAAAQTNETPAAQASSPDELNALTLTFFTHRNASRLSEAGISLHYNGFVYLTEGINVELYQVEKSVVKEEDKTTITVTVTLVGEGTTDSNGEVSFQVASGHYFTKVQPVTIGQKTVSPPRIPILIFSDRSIYVPLERLILAHHR